MDTRGVTEEAMSFIGGDREDLAQTFVDLSEGRILFMHID